MRSASRRVNSAGLKSVIFFSLIPNTPVILAKARIQLPSFHSRESGNPESPKFPLLKSLSLSLYKRENFSLFRKEGLREISVSLPYYPSLTSLPQGERNRDCPSLVRD